MTTFRIAPIQLADGEQMSLLDTDHFRGIGGNQSWVRKCFLRGLNKVLYSPCSLVKSMKPDRPDMSGVRRCDPASNNGYLIKLAGEPTILRTTGVEATSDRASTTVVKVSHAQLLPPLIAHGRIDNVVIVLTPNSQRHLPDGGQKVLRGPIGIAVVGDHYPETRWS